MQTRAAAGLAALVVSAGVAGHVLGGHAVAQPHPPQPQAPAPVPGSAAPAQGSHVLWLRINGRWRAVPS